MGTHRSILISQFPTAGNEEIEIYAGNDFKGLTIYSQLTDALHLDQFEGNDKVIHVYDY